MAISDGQKKLIQLPRPRFNIDKALIDRKIERLEQMRSERSEYLGEWKDISDFIQIRRGKYLISEGRKIRRSKKVLNETATYASRTLGAGMLAGISSPSRPWLKLQTPDPALNEFQSAKRWLDIAQRRLYQAFAVSNYYLVKQTSYRDMGDFGQGPMLIDEDYENAINCTVASPGEYFLDINHRNVVDTLYREFRWSTIQCMRMFGYNNCAPRIRNSFDRGNYNDMWDVVQAVEPNSGFEPGIPGPAGMPFASVYFTPMGGANDENVFEVKGYHENPISAARWDVQSGDVYGDGPGSLVLASTKSLQTLERRKGQLIDKLTAPTLALPASMKNNVIDHSAGHPTFFPDQAMVNGPRGYELYQTQYQSVTVTAAEINVMEQRVNTGYFVDLFLMLENSDRRQITAREIEERHEEKLIGLGPVLERSHYEGLNIEVMRTFGVLARNGVIPPPPPELDGMPLQVQYTSLLAVAQRSVGVSSMERFAGFVGNLSAGNPEILDKWDMEQTVDEYSELIGVPASTVRSDDEVAKMREQRSAKQQQVENMALAQQGAETAKVLSETDTARGSNSNLLADLMGGAV